MRFREGPGNCCHVDIPVTSVRLLLVGGETYCDDYHDGLICCGICDPMTKPDCQTQVPGIPRILKPLC